MQKETLNDSEIRIARIIGRCLSSAHKGKSKAVTSAKIIRGMEVYAQDRGIRLSDSVIRKMINWLRLNNECPGLCSSPSGGYYVADSISELKECCDKLRDRIISQCATERALRRQLIKWQNENQQTLL